MPSPQGPDDRMIMGESAMQRPLSNQHSSEGPAWFRSRGVGILLVLLVAGSSGAFALNTTVLGPAADATVLLGPDRPNLGADDYLGIGHEWDCGPGDEEVSYIRFDLSPIPTNAVVRSAEFSACEYDGYQASSKPFVRAVWVCASNDWDELAIVGDNRPTEVTAAGPLSYDGRPGPRLGSERGVLYDEGGVLWQAVCDAVRSGGKQLTLVLSAQDAYVCERGFFRSREAAADGPMLAVTWEPPLIADAGPDQVVDAEGTSGAWVTLAGSATGGEEPYSYKWECARTTAFEPWTMFRLKIGEHDAKLTVVDANGRSATDTAHITVKLPDTVVEAGSPQTLEASSNDGAIALLAGSATPSQCFDYCTWTVLGHDYGVWKPWVLSVQLPLGTHTATFTAKDVFGRTSSDTVQVTVVDTRVPKIWSAVATPSVLTPADGKMKSVTVAVTATDVCDPAPRAYIAGVTCNESTNPRKLAWSITGDLTVNLQATCSSRTTDRVYTIALACVDASGNRSTATVKVTVPRTPKGKGR